LSCDHSTVYGVLAKATLSVLAVHVHDGVVSFVGVVVLGVPGVEGAVVSTTTVPLLEYDDVLPKLSLALTRKYQVPWVSADECVKLAVADVDDETPLPKSEACDHSTVYGVLSSPAPPSVEAVHVQLGVVSAVGVVVPGVPGVDGAVVSTTTVPVIE